MSEVGVRERRRVQTRNSIQEHAMRLFLERGFDATTVSDVAAAADVSSMTVFRHFPTKEDLVLADEYDHRIVDLIGSQPSGGSLLRRIGRGLCQGVSGLSTGEREMLLGRLRLIMSTPGLRSRRWDNQYATQRAIVAALRSEDAHTDFVLEVSVGACLSAAGTAVIHWVERDGRPDLADLMARAVAVITGDRPSTLLARPRAR
jgi:AcrR family transcriptional regulator